jgi:polysaccharide export outer membrane protein
MHRRPNANELRGHDTRSSVRAARGGAGLGGLLALALLALPIAPPASAQSPDYVIGAQDVLSIAVWDQEDLAGKFAVESDGTFTFPLVGRVKAGGLTLREVEAELIRLLKDGFFINPQVTVAVEQYRSQQVFVVGEVRTPGAQSLTGDMTLIEVLARAGSTLPSAGGEAVIVRPPAGSVVGGPWLPDLGADGGTGAVPGGSHETGDARTHAEVMRVDIRDLENGVLAQNVRLRDGDTVFVPRAPTMFVFGQVRNPGEYPITSQITVLQSLSLAGGVTDRGSTSRIRIVRLVDGEKVEIGAKLNDLVEPGDTVIVQERFF